jgi:NAD(P)-dependent dehydrogenase (short-subunit alcohol dehydrogenase family)
MGLAKVDRNADVLCEGDVMGVLVTGGTGALGSAVLRELIGAGYDVTTTWIVERERERIETELGDEVALVKADLTLPEGAEDAAAAVEPLEAVVNLVGGFMAGPKLHETEPHDFARMLELNVTTAFHMARAAAPVLVANGGGAFVAVSARPALRPFPGSAAYSVSKAGVLALVQAMDADYKNDGVRANAILPSVIDTPANRANEPDADFSKWVQTEDIAKVIRFLISPDSAPTSGAAVPVYGRA